MSEPTGRKGLHWFAPGLAIGSFTAAVLLAVGHDQFYCSLNGRLTSTNEYNIMGNRFSAQQFNLAIGNTFALLVRSAFALSTSVAFCQIFWRLARRESSFKRPPTLKRLDAVYSAPSNLFNLFYLPIWCRYPLLCSTAAISWLIPMTSIITPATLSVATRTFSTIAPQYVPTLDFANLNYVAGMPYRAYRTYTSDYFYNGPSTIVQQIAIAVAAQNTVLPITAPAPNSSWEMSFHAPNIACDDVPSNTSLAIEQSIYNYLVDGHQKNCNTPPIFAAWYPQISTDCTSLINEPYVTAANSSSSIPEQFLPNPDAILSKPCVTVPLSTKRASFYAAVFPGLATATYLTWYGAPAACLLNSSDPNRKLNNAYHVSKEAPLGLLGRNATVLQCRLLNSTYKTKFENVNGDQNVAIELSDPATDQEVPLVGWTEISGSEGSCDWTSTDGTACRLNASQAEQMAYQGVLQAFTTLITGHWTFGDAGLRRAEFSKIGSTALIRSKEFAILTGANNVQDPVIANAIPVSYGPDHDMYLQEVMINSSVLTNHIYSGIPRAAHDNTSTSIGVMMEGMFRKIVVSYMSSPELTQDRSAHYPADTYPLSNVDVTIERWESIYVYTRAKLWIAYGIAIGTSLCALAFGAFAMLANDATYSNNFSTILLSGHNAEFSVEVAERDQAASDPLPAYLEKATVQLQTGRHEVEGMPMMTVAKATSNASVNTGLDTGGSGALRSASTW